MARMKALPIIRDQWDDFAKLALDAETTAEPRAGPVTPDQPPCKNAHQPLSSKSRSTLFTISGVRGFVMKSFTMEKVRARS